MTTLFVSITCKGHGESKTPGQSRPGLRLLRALRANAAPWGGGIAVVPVACPAHCARASTVALSGAGKGSDLGALDPDRDAAGVVAVAALPHADAAGVPPWRQRPTHVRKPARAQIPPPSRLPPQPETAAR
jgi:predicted metal-binding protein